MEAVLARLCEKRGSLAKTQAVKFPYLIDVISMHVLGRGIVNATYQAWKHGVVAQEAWALLKHGSPMFSVEEEQYREEILVRLVGAPPSRLSPQEQAIVDFVADEYGSMSSTALGKLTKHMNPNIESWGSNEEADTSESAYLEMFESNRQLRKRLECADLSDESKRREIGNVSEFVDKAFS